MRTPTVVIIYALCRVQSSNQISWPAQLATQGITKKQKYCEAEKYRMIMQDPLETLA